MKVILKDNIKEVVTDLEKRSNTLTTGTVIEMYRAMSILESTKQKIKEIKGKVEISNKEIMSVSQAIEELSTAMNEIESGVQNISSSSSEIEEKAMEQTENENDK